MRWQIRDAEESGGRTVGTSAKESDQSQTENVRCPEQEVHEIAYGDFEYHNRAIETIQVIEELINMSKEFAAAAKRGNELGLNLDETTFYDALAENEASVRASSDHPVNNRDLYEKL